MCGMHLRGDTLKWQEIGPRLVPGRLDVAKLEEALLGQGSESAAGHAGADPSGYGDVELADRGVLAGQADGPERQVLLTSLQWFPTGLAPYHPQSYRGRVK